MSVRVYYNDLGEVIEPSGVTADSAEWQVAAVTAVSDQEFWKWRGSGNSHMQGANYHRSCQSLLLEQPGWTLKQEELTFK